MKSLMPPINTPDNLFHDGNPTTGVEGTIVPAEHLNNEQGSIRDVQSELIAILTAAAMAPDSTAGQLLVALNKLYAPGNDTLGALASLVGAANKLPYFTGPKGASLTDLTAFAREVLAQTDAAGVLSKLGLENATKAIIHTGKVIADLNAPPKNSTGFAYQDAQNSPGFNATVLTVDSIEGSYDIQIAIGYNPLKFAFRAYSGDAKVWLNWVVLGNAAAKNTGTTAGTVAAGDDSRITGAIQRNAMVGAVSQTGGAPTGAIIERGSNSNGEYTKFADGTLICWFTRSAESTANNSSGGTTNLYFSSEVGLTFPATFVGTTPTVTPSASLSSGGTSSWPSVRGRSLTGTSLALISNVQNAAAYLGYTAIGRWF
ncbi:hypothetical protein ICA20_019735 [Citrobacter sp. C5_2]|uniref:hypothetical protein n=1 Tax=Citrobacter TaxID=544 RepID=UPI001E48BEEC|nr:MULTISPECIES: hypothetical protein [Citrobacter]